MAKGFQVRMSYGGAASAYAEAIHEHESPSSPPSWRGKSVNFQQGGVKYLEKPLKKRANGMLARYRAFIDL